MTEGKKYTFVEKVLGIILGGFLGGAVILAFVPVDLALAWLRVQVWNWFLVPYLHAPVMNIWLMFALIFFVSMWRKSPRDLRKDLYEESLAHTFVWGILTDLIAFGICFCVHHWFLKG